MKAYGNQVPKIKKGKQFVQQTLQLGLERVHVSIKLESEGMGAILRSAERTV